MKKLFKEFKEFISRGNVIDLAVGLIIGSAFTAIVNSVVKDLFMPIIALITRNVLVPEGEQPPVFNIDAFLSALINFLVVALVVFFIVKAFNKLKSLAPKKEEPLVPTEKECPFCKSKISINAVRCPHCTSHLEEQESML